MKCRRNLLLALLELFSLLFFIFSEAEYFLGYLANCTYHARERTRRRARELRSQWDR